MDALQGLWSPRLQILQQQLQRGNAAALPAFWEWVATHGTPLIEQSNDDHFLVTLVWRDGEQRAFGELTCAFGGILNSRKMAHPLFSLDASDLWYRTYRLPDTMRATYHFFVNGEPVSDPLSQHVLVVPSDTVSPFGMHEMKLAIVELPHATPESWGKRRPDVLQGNMQSQRLYSVLIGHDYRLSVYTPHGYQSEQTAYPLVLLFDEWTYTQVIPTPAILDVLIADGVIPPLVTVLFGHIEREDRMREMNFYEPFFAFLVEELLPWIRQHYHVTHERAHTTIAGASMGGIAALYSGLRYPEHFGNIYSHTGSFHTMSAGERAYQRLERAIPERTHTSQHVYLDVGMLECDEMGFGSSDGGPNAVDSNCIVRNFLRARGYQVTYSEYTGGHDLLWGAATLADALKMLVCHPSPDHTPFPEAR